MNKSLLIFIGLLGLTYGKICWRCPMWYAPVCGTDDKTYQNSCQLECQTEGSEVLPYYSKLLG